MYHASWTHAKKTLGKREMKTAFKTRERRDVCTPTRCSLQVKKLPAYTAETSIRTTLKLSHGEMMSPEPELRNRAGIIADVSDMPN